jgi:RNA polymerase sigma-70 factor (ECF subfamily)
MAGDDPFEGFVRAHQQMVFATAVRLLGSPSDAEDIAQEVFLKAFEHFETLASSGTAAAWLRTVTRNRCLNHLSRYRRRWRFFSELDTDAGPEGTPPYEATLVGADPAPLDVELAEERERLERALRALPAHQRVPLVLFHFEQASYQEIADALGVSVGKVKTDIHRAREALKKHLRPEDAAR